jgi:hypothetical protein
MISLKDLRNLEKDDLLKLLGVEERRGAVDIVAPALGFFAAGVLIGTGIGMMLAPRPGRELRQDLKGRLQSTGTMTSPTARAGVTTPPNA